MNLYLLLMGSGLLIETKFLRQGVPKYNLGTSSAKKNIITDVSGNLAFGEGGLPRL